MEAIKQLESMIGQTFMYYGEPVKFINYTKDEFKVEILTDVKDFKIPLLKLESKLEEFRPLRANQLQRNEQESSVLPAINAEMLKGMSSLNGLTDVLLDNIRKVQENPGFIPQAQQINKDVSAITDIMKTQVDMFRVVTKGGQQ